jgi:DNA-binding transcriptional ArsR family regulator
MPAVGCAEPCEADVVNLRAAQAAQRTMPDPVAIERMTALFALLATATRLRLVLALRSPDGTSDVELCVCDLAAVIGASESLVSHQLRLLREAGIVAFRREGKLVLYRLAEGPLRHLLEDAVEYIGARGSRKSA